MDNNSIVTVVHCSHESYFVQCADVSSHKVILVTTVVFIIKHYTTLVIL